MGDGMPQEGRDRRYLKTPFRRHVDTQMGWSDDPNAWRDSLGDVLALADLRRRIGERYDGELRTQLSLEQETALLRETEARLEQARDQQYAASDAVNAAQGSLYEVNAEVSRLETEIRFVAETRARGRLAPRRPSARGRRRSPCAAASAGA